MLILQGKLGNNLIKYTKKLEVFGGHLLRMLSEDDHSHWGHWALPYWKIKRNFSLDRTEVIN